jgi:hypothetical protein
MAGNDMEAQEALARDFQPALEVGWGCKWDVINAEFKQGPLVGEKKSSRAITEEYAKADPIYVAKTAVSTSAGVNYPLIDRLPGLTTEIFTLPANTGGWKLRMAG